MDKIEKALVVSVFASLVMFSLNIEGAYLFCALSFGSLSIFYFTLGFKFFNESRFVDKTVKNERGKARNEQLTSFLLGFSFSVVILSLLFQLLDWDGGRTLFIVSLIILLYPFIKVQFKNENQHPKYLEFLTHRIVFLFGFGLVTIVIKSL